MRLGPGTLYGVLARLEARAFIEPMKTQDRRNPYRITPLGEKALKVRLAALEVVARVAQRRLARA